MNEVIQTWRMALADAIAAGMYRPGDLWPVPVEGADARVTLRRLADNLEHDQAPVPPAVCTALRLPEGARFEDAVRALRAMWELQA